MEGVKVYYLDITQIDRNKYFYFRSKVSEKRRQQADKFRFIEDSYRCVSAELLAKYSLSLNDKYKGIFDLRYNEYGKPYLSDYNNLFFNISHSGNYVVCAVAETEVGIDVEKVQSGLSGSVDSLYNSKELEYVYEARGEEFDNRMIQIWTMKESFCKYLGKGLSAGLEKYCVDPHSGIVSNSEGVIPDIKISCLLPIKNYFISVCSLEPIIKVQNLTIDDLLIK